MSLSWQRWLAAASLGLSAMAAQAGNVQWSIGINLPLASTVISDGPYYPYQGAAYPGYATYPSAPYYAPPVAVYPPAPIYYAPPRAVYRPAPIYYAPPRAVYRPAPIYYNHPHPAYGQGPGWSGPSRGYRDGHRDGHWDHHRDGSRGEYRGPRGGDDRHDRRGWPGRD